MAYRIRRIFKPDGTDVTPAAVDWRVGNVFGFHQKANEPFVVSDELGRYLLATGAFEVAPYSSGNTSSQLLYLPGENLPTDQATLARWPDQSPAANHGTQPTAAKQAQLLTENGNRFARFDQTNDELLLPVGLRFTAASVFTVVMAFRVRGTGGLGRLLYDGDGAGWFFGTVYDPARPIDVGGFSNQQEVARQPLTPERWVVLTVKVGASTTRVFLNGTDITTSATPHGTPGQLRIGGVDRYSFCGGFDVGDLMIDGRDLPSSEQQGWEQAFMTKWVKSTSSSSGNSGSSGGSGGTGTTSGGTNVTPPTVTTPGGSSVTGPTVTAPTDPPVTPTTPTTPTTPVTPTPPPSPVNPGDVPVEPTTPSTPNPKDTLGTTTI